MADSFRALCSDFYVNQKLSVKLDLPRSRETVLDLFERVRRQYDNMQSFKRYREELALESGADAQPHRWLAIRSNNVRSGVVNPADFDDAYGLHRLVLESAPYFLSVSPLDVEYIELLYGFDLAAGGNHDRIVARALMGDSPLSHLAEVDGARPIDFQPIVGLSLGLDGGPPVEVHFEVKTRSGERGDGEEPISIYLTLRLYEPVADVKDFGAALDRVREAGESLVHDRVLPSLLVPIREAIAAEGV